MYTMQQACQMVGIPYETLKYYCKCGLLDCAQRTDANHRRFDDYGILCIKNVMCLRNARFGIEEMRDYLAMIPQGNDSIPARRKILDKKKQEIREQMELLEDALAFIARKEIYYDQKLAGLNPDPKEVYAGCRVLERGVSPRAYE